MVQGNGNNSSSSSIDVRASSSERPIMEAVKRLSVVNEVQDKYSIAVSKYIDIDDYLRSLLNVTHYEVSAKRGNTFKIVFYNKSRVIKSINGCVCKDSTFLIPRVELARRRCYLYNVYLNFRLFG